MPPFSRQSEKRLTISAFVTYAEWLIGKTTCAPYQLSPFSNSLKTLFVLFIHFLPQFPNVMIDWEVSQDSTATHTAARSVIPFFHGPSSQPNKRPLGFLFLFLLLLYFLGNLFSLPLCVLQYSLDSFSLRRRIRFPISFLCVAPTDRSSEGPARGAVYSQNLVSFFFFRLYRQSESSLMLRLASRKERERKPRKEMKQ